MIARLASAAAVFALLTMPGLAQGEPPATDYLKRAENFLANCDARKNDAGERPDPNFLCLAFVAGLIEGYTTAAVANGNERPYCLPRPVTLVEMMDMMVTVVERGTPEGASTATVFHYILEANFPCGEAGAAGQPAEAGAE